MRTLIVHLSNLTRERGLRSEWTMIADRMRKTRVMPESDLTLRLKDFMKNHRKKDIVICISITTGAPVGLSRH